MSSLLTESEGLLSQLSGSVAFMVMAYTAIYPYASDTEVSLETDGYQLTESRQSEEPSEEPVEVREEQFWVGLSIMKAVTWIWQGRL